MQFIIAKSVLITGASTGIGEACARYLAERGWRVFAGVRQAVDAKRLAGERITPITLDVTQAKQIEQAIQAIREIIGGDGLQGLVNNAGIAVAGPLEFIPMEDLRRQLEVNFLGQVAVTQAALPLLRVGQGRIVNMSSISGRIAAPMFGPYASSKFALEAFSDALRRELLPWGLQVASIEPGAIKTPIWEKGGETAQAVAGKLTTRAQALYGEIMAKIPRYARRSNERGLEPHSVAEAVHHALSARRPKTRYVVGPGTRLSILASRLLPDRWMDRIITRRLYR